ncbi:endolytic transglycosylase MltG [Candidatus Kaiserbacteria bacterium]|nr:endolytic transglycosylase MltG [Candidatus Kaiserbacteria bacterium]NCT02257.1 endolytic transglycosylase MltG [Candidatus Parcubacteria bacterium]
MFSRRSFIKLIYGVVFLLTLLSVIGTVVLLKSKTLIFSSAQPVTTAVETALPFPFSVNAHTKIITENPEVSNYFFDTLANRQQSTNNWWNQVASLFASKHWYQNLASPVSRIIVIWPGERKEEITKNISDVLGWSADNQIEFQRLVDSSEPVLKEGKYFPGQYVAHRSANPADIVTLLNESFSSEVLNRYTKEVAAAVPLDETLVIASLLEREASDFTNMREISGVIWNRLFIGMPLQLDATLQYVKGGNPEQPRWWPAVRPPDKYLDSPYNTYQHSGLPPAPIANPSAEAILAALNPIKTDCLFYFHTKDGTYHCSPTYEIHVQKLRSIYGRGS